MSTWQQVRVEDVAVLYDGPHATPASPKTAKSGPVFLGISSLQDGRLDLSQSGYLSDEDFVRWTRRVTPRAGDVVFSYETRLGQAAIVPVGLRCALGRRLALMRPDKDAIDPRFLLYSYLGPAFQETIRRNTVAGSTVDRILLRAFPRFPLLLPPMHEQRGIAESLGALDDKIQSNLRLQQTAAELALATIGNATRGATETGYEDVMSVIMGSAFKGDAFSAPGTGRPLLRIRDLKTFVSQTWTTEERTDETLIRPGDIVAGMDAEFRATLWQGMPSLLNQRVCAFRPHDGVSRAFVLSAVAPQLAFFEKAKSGTTVIHLNRADINRFLVPRLDSDQHAQLTEQTEPLLDVVVNASAQSIRLAALRDALLPELLSGRIRVPEAGEAVESALA